MAFLVNQTEKSIDLATAYMFTEKKCRKHQMMTINRFRKDDMKWENTNFYPKKYRNFHNCLLTYATFGEIEMSLYEMVLGELSKDFHFEIEFDDIETLDRFMRLRKLRTYDFYRGSTQLDHTDNVHVVVTSEKTIYVVPPGEPLTSFEKLLSPFDAETWISILTTLAVSLVAVKVASVASKRIKSLVIGRNIGSPSMNLLNIFLCGGQTNVPSSSSARILFISFVIWSMMFRTCFQSLSYRALQMDLRHPSMKTLEDLIQHKFSQYVEAYFEDSVRSREAKSM